MLYYCKRGVCMVKFYKNRDDDNYIMVDAKSISDLLADDDFKMHCKVYAEACDVYAMSFNKTLIKTFGYVKEIAIKKDSLLASYLISCADGERILNCDEYISYDKIVNALSIAMFNDDYKMSNKVFALFKSQVSGTKSELSEKYCLKAIEYILENDDFKTYIDKYNGVYTGREYIIYEDGQYQQLVLNSHDKVKVKSIEEG